MKKIGFTLLLFYACSASAQFDTQVGSGAVRPIHKDSSIIVAWATHCSVMAGWQQANDSSYGRANSGSAGDALGKSDGTTLSLGDRGEAILQFASPIKNGTGYDFCVFENGFRLSQQGSEAFLELAHVEVSSDGIHFFRFPDSSFLDTAIQTGPYDYTEAYSIYNLAGKYTAPYGTPFDLDELMGIPQLNLNQVTHVKITDVCGSINDSFCSRDSRGWKIPDPWPTPFPSGGFDLDAIGVIHQVAGNSIAELQVSELFNLYPNPIVQGEIVCIRAAEPGLKAGLFDAAGRLISESESGESTLFFPTYNLGNGFYYLTATSKRGSQTFKIVLN